MGSNPKIEFQEVSHVATDFLHELNDPALLRGANLPSTVVVELRKHQVLRLKENISLLVGKREEFNRKMESYIENLRALVRSIEKTVCSEIERFAGDEASQNQATLVRCMSCDTQQLFKELQIVFARESEDSLASPTDVYVLQGSVLKKGHFSCHECGATNLVIRSI